MSNSQSQRARDGSEDDVDELVEDEPVDDEFMITDRLQAPEAMIFTTRNLHTLIHQGQIDLNPPYQRDVVWTESKQIKLVDSLYHNYYVPPIVFAVVRDEDGDEVRRCVDGKQRLTSIQKFIDGQIPYKDPHTKKSYWYTLSEHMKSRLEVPEQWKRDFDEKRITCVEYRNLPPGLERDIFQRVQLGIPLTAAEKLQAIASPWAEWISELSMQRVTSDTGIADQIDVDLSRGRDFQSVAQLVLCCDSIPDPVVPTAQKLEHWLQRTDDPSELFKFDIVAVLQKFHQMSSSRGLNAGFVEIKQRVAPVEFVFIGVLLYIMKDCSNEECAKVILDMRQEVRRQFKDIRFNTFVVKHLWAFLSNVADEYETGFYIDSPDAAKPARKTRKRQRRSDEGPSRSSTKPATKRGLRDRKNA